jgi:subfamily B ATP-binding cassette protein HlyB/CyaB
MSLIDTPSISPQAVSQILRENPVFSLLDDGELDSVAQKMTTVQYQVGQAVFLAGEPGDSFYVVVSGRARVVGRLDSGSETTVAALSKGQSFGESSLLNDSVRAYTVRAAEDLVLLRLSKSDFIAMVAEKRELRRFFQDFIADTSLRNFLKLCSVFSPLNPSEIREVLDCLHPVDIAQNEAIVREGEVGDAFYILKSGEARVEKAGRILKVLRPGDGFGELALLTGAPRAADVIATKPSAVFKLGKVDFDRLVNEKPKMRQAFVSLASGYSADALRTDEPLADTAPPELQSAQNSEFSAGKGKQRKKFPALLQHNEMDCGAACLAMILRYYGKNVGINRLRNLVNVTQEGATLQSVADGAEALGFHARGLRTDMAHLSLVPTPAIAHWEGYHYIVLVDVQPNRITVADPAIGIRHFKPAEFEKGWTGYILQLETTSKLHMVEESKSTLARYVPMIKQYKGHLVEILIASLMLQLFSLAMPIFTQVLVDKVLVQRNGQMLNALLVGMLLIALFQAATSLIREYLIVHTSRRIDLQMAISFYRHALSLPLRFFEDRKIGDILLRFEENAKIRHLLTGRTLTAVLDMSMIVIYLALMFIYNVKLALVALAFIPLYFLLSKLVTPIMVRLSREFFQRSSESQSRLVESISGIGTVKATATERQIRWRWETATVRAMNTHFRSSMMQVGAVSGATLIEVINTTVILWYGARLVMASELSVGQLMAFYALAFGITRAILNIVALYDDFTEAKIAVERLNDVFETEPEEDMGKHSPIRLPRLRGHIQFENVTFRYPSRANKNALQNVTLDIQPGQTVALVGRSGAGKSTFANLLLRLHSPNDGKVLIDGYDLQQAAIGSLRSQVGVVPQDVFLFSGTIRENIALGDADAPMEEVVGAAMLAGAHDFISQLPLGYQTVIGERGQSLSGGQKQRIAIARALYPKPRVLIFDEATSALDVESERAIQNNLDNILRDRTTIIIAHRLSTVRNADMIVVLDQGVVIEVGAHAELMERKGLYYYLNSQQLEG